MECPINQHLGFNKWTKRVLYNMPDWVGYQRARKKSRQSKAPIFLHSGWRTGSTYVWNKFREQASNLAFYEPFHEMLGVLSPIDVVNITFNSWPSGHSPLDLPYFTEFAPLINNQGVAGYFEEFAYKNFFANELRSSKQKVYVESLLGEGNTQGRRPVLGFCRSTGRMSWMVREFQKSIHILILRHPLQQWMSMYFQNVNNGNDYFLIMPIIILRLSEGDSFAHLVRQTYGINLNLNETFEETRQYSREWLLSAGIEKQFELFLFLFVLTYIESRFKVDMSLDVDKLSSSAHYRRVIARRLSKICGEKIDFADASIKSYDLKGIPFSVSDHVERVFGTFYEFINISGNRPFGLKKGRLIRLLSYLDSNINRTNDFE